VKSPSGRNASVCRDEKSSDSLSTLAWIAEVCAVDGTGPFEEANASKMSAEVVQQPWPLAATSDEHIYAIWQNPARPLERW